MVNESLQVCLRKRKNFEEYVAKHLSKGYRLPKRAKNPFAIGCCPELCVPSIGTGILLSVLDRSNEADARDLDCILHCHALLVGRNKLCAVHIQTHCHILCLYYTWFFPDSATILLNYPSHLCG